MKCRQNKQKMIYSNSKEGTSKSSEQQNLGSLLLKSSKLYQANGIKAINHILIYSRSDEGTPKSNTRNAIQESNRILTESKPEVQKMLICSKSRKSTVESKEATRFSNTSVDLSANHCYKCAKRKILQSDV